MKGRTSSTPSHQRAASKQADPNIPYHVDPSIRMSTEKNNQLFWLNYAQSIKDKVGAIPALLKFSSLPLKLKRDLPLVTTYQMSTPTKAYLTSETTFLQRTTSSIILLPSTVTMKLLIRRSNSAPEHRFTNSLTRPRFLNWVDTVRRSLLPKVSLTKLGGKPRY